MACLSNEYLTDNRDATTNREKKPSPMFSALIYSTATDLTALLIATKTGVDKLPIITLSEAKA